MTQTSISARLMSLLLVCAVLTSSQMVFVPSLNAKKKRVKKAGSSKKKTDKARKKREKATKKASDKKAKDAVKKEKKLGVEGTEAQKKVAKEGKAQIKEMTNKRKDMESLEKGIYYNVGQIGKATVHPRELSKASTLKKLKPQTVGKHGAKLRAAIRKFAARMAGENKYKALPKGYEQANRIEAELGEYGKEVRQRRIMLGQVLDDLSKQIVETWQRVADEQAAQSRYAVTEAA